MVLTRSYPAPGDLYKYPFVHRRVLAYLNAGHDVLVFQPADRGSLASHEFEGVTCWTGSGEDFGRLTGEWKPDVIAAHGFTEAMWEMLRPIASKIPVRAWLHGSEIPGFMRRKAVVAPQAQRQEAMQQLRRRCEFWDRFLAEAPPLVKLVFVSRTSIGLAREDWGDRFDERLYSVIPNPIDTDLFEYREKSPEDRFKVLLIRPFDSQTYANDLAVDAILRLSERRGFEQLSFTIIGDGPLFDETLAPLAGLGNIRIERRFLSQEEIVAEHGRHGIFLVPTRLDTQGVSRDEAMASGLVPVTNAIPAVCEFVDESSAAIAPPDDADGLASALWAMVENPDLLLARSVAAAKRIRSDRGNDRIIPRELALLAEAANG